MNLFKKLAIVGFILCYVLYLMYWEQCYEGEDVYSF